mgnify:FL=1
MDKLYCFDLDGTITSEELLPLIAAELDLYEEISTLTTATINGLIPFEKSFRLRCKILSEMTTEKIQNVAEKISLDEPIVNFIKANKDNSYIITGNIYEWIKPITEKIGCRVLCSKGEFNNGKLKELKEILDKGKAVKKLKESNKSIISVGDGMGDVLMFEESDVSIAFGGVHEPIKTLRDVSNYLVYDGSALCRLLNTL